MFVCVFKNRNGEFIIKSRVNPSVWNKTKKMKITH